MPERRLGKLIELILVATLPATAAACDADDAGVTADAASEVEQNCFTDPNWPRTYQDAEISYAICDPGSDASTGDAGQDATGANDAALDAGAADGADLDAQAEAAPHCYANCAEACQSTRSSWNTSGTCLYDKSVGREGKATCTYLVPCGRRPAGLRAPSARSGRAVGRWLGESAWLEAASIYAFHRLEGDLRTHGAPAALIRSTRCAARDERRHARTMTRLARQRGARVPRVAVDEVGERSLEAIAVENAVEACVGETYGALIAAWQARRASDESIRAAYETIAKDELRHAELGWEVARWIDTRLDEEARRRVEAARRAAVTRLMDDVRDPEVDGREELGLPSADESQKLIRRLFASLS